MHFTYLFLASSVLTCILTTHEITIPETTNCYQQFPIKWLATLLFLLLTFQIEPSAVKTCHINIPFHRLSSKHTWKYNIYMFWDSTFCMVPIGREFFCNHIVFKYPRTSFLFYHILPFWVIYVSLCCIFLLLICFGSYNNFQIQKFKLLFVCSLWVV